MAMALFILVYVMHESPCKIVDLKICVPDKSIMSMFNILYNSVAMKNVESLRHTEARYHNGFLVSWYINNKGWTGLHDLSYTIPIR